MSQGPRVLTRAAVFYGDRFSDACSAFRVTGAELDKAGVVSTGTITKLNRRYRGSPVEAATRDRIIDHFRKTLNQEIRERLAARGIDLENILLPATFRLTERACLLYERLGMPYRIAGVLRADLLYDQGIHIMMRGGFGVYKHVIAVAEHIYASGREDPAAQWITSAVDLVEDVPDPNACHPSIYRIEHVHREAQLTLLPGGRSS